MDESNLGSAAGKGTPRFEFHPQPAGRAVGIRAFVERNGQEIQTADFEIDLLPSDGKATAGKSTQALHGASQRPNATDVGVQKPALCGAAVGDQPDTMDTIGTVCWIVNQVGVGVTSIKNANNKMLFLTRDGWYGHTFASREVYFPPDLVSFGTMAGVGCLKTERQISKTWFLDLYSRSISIGGLAGFNLVKKVSLATDIPTGFSIFQSEDGKLARGIEYDSTAGLGIGLPIEFPLSISIQTKSVNTQWPTLMRATDCGQGELVDLGMSDGDAQPDSARQALADAVGPLAKNLLGSHGEPPGDNVVAGSNADAIANLGSNDPSERCDGCPATNLDDLIDDLKEAFDTSANGEEVASKAIPHLKQLPNALPSPASLDVLLRRAQPGFALAGDVIAQRAHNGKDVFVGQGMVTIPVKVGVEAEFKIEPQELAKLLAHPLADVLGATLEVDGSPQISATKFTLADQPLVLTFTPGSPEPFVIHTAVNLSTAQGSFPADVQDWYVALTPRLVRPESGAAAQAELSGPSRVASGGSLALNAVVMDEMGSPVSKPAHVRFEDGEGNTVGEADTAYGIATIEYVPKASLPVLQSAALATLTRGNVDVEGVILRGSGISVDVQIFAEGQLLDPKTVQRDVESSTKVLVATPLPLGARVYIENPGGQRSREVQVTDG